MKISPFSFVISTTPVCCCCCQDEGRKSRSFGEYKKHRGMEASTRFCAHTQKRAKAHILIALCHRYASVDRFRPVHHHFRAGSRWFCWTDDERERNRALRDRFFPDRNFLIFPSALRSIQNASSSAETLEEKNANSTLAKHTHKEREREREREREEKTTKKLKLQRKKKEK